jgi:hypothetical protein
VSGIGEHEVIYVNVRVNHNGMLLLSTIDVEESRMEMVLLIDWITKKGKNMETRNGKFTLVKNDRISRIVSIVLRALKLTIL